LPWRRTRIGDQRIGLLALPFDRCQRRQPELVERPLGEGRLAQEPADELDHGGQLRPFCGDGDAQRLPRRGEAHGRVEAIEAVGDLLPRHSGAALVEQRGDERGHRRLALERPDIAIVQAEPRMDDSGRAFPWRAAQPASRCRARNAACAHRGWPASLRKPPPVRSRVAAEVLDEAATSTRVGAGARSGVVVGR
jgi:hypothetical protein